MEIQGYINIMVNYLNVWFLLELGNVFVLSVFIRKDCYL